MDTLQRAAQCFHQALAAQQAGRLQEAERLYREALVLAPDRPSVLLNLAVVLIRRHAFAEALRLTERVLQLQPGDPDALQNAALIRHQMHGASGDVGPLQQAVAARGEDPEALNNLGLALRAAGDDAGALRAFDRALELAPELAGARANRAALLAARGRDTDAQRDCLAALDAHPGAHSAQRGFFELCARKGFVPAPDSAAFRARLREALAAPWGRPQALAPLCLRLLRGDAALAAQLEGAPAVAAALSPASTALLAALLPRALLADPAFEAWWVRLRDALVLKVAGGLEPDELELSMLAALAAQAFLCEYLPDTAPDVAAAGETLAAQLAARAADPVADVPPAWVAACASLVPLSRLACADAIARRRWPEAVQRLVDEQIRAAVEEAHLRARMPRLTPIQDAVSQKVRAQYEENPYPRWSGLPRGSEPLGLGGYLAARLSGTSRHVSVPSGPLRTLVAGGGTGQQPIEIAQAVAGTDVLVIDLSVASLAYAQRHAQAMGLSNLRFAQADLLLLGQRGLQFDLIECSGVLHHLAEPRRGLAVLVSLLRPNGWMRLALYSEAGRRAVAEARARIAQRGWNPDLAGMRACRADLLALPAAHPARGVLAFNDFYAASPCRDLLFHVQEHRFTLPAVAAMLAEAKLTFAGFELPEAVRETFMAQHAEPGALLDLAAWDRFEDRHPDTFAGMYQFWVTRAR